MDEKKTKSIILQCLSIGPATIEYLSLTTGLKTNDVLLFIELNKMPVKFFNGRLCLIETIKSVKRKSHALINYPVTNGLGGINALRG
jgi:hypothetical protein